MSHNVAELEEIFNNCFSETENTILTSGGEEPIYLPKSQDGMALIVSTKDYFSSALHEISHWCIAGKERRKLEDYGYWYEPDGRTLEQQREFERVEVKPQALEWVFTQACGLSFRISSDNINNPDVPVSAEFKSLVTEQAKDYVCKGLTGRAAIFLDALLKYYGFTTSDIKESKFDRGNI